MTQQQNDEQDDLSFLNANIELIDQEIENWVSEQTPDREKAQLEDTSVITAQYKESTAQDMAMRQGIAHEQQNQKIRIQHLNYLFILTIIWIVFIWLILILQGYAGYPFRQTSKIYDFLPFHLSDAVIIAFMTTTTATVLGLYGIGAYWLFKSKIQKAQEDSPQE